MGLLDGKVVIITGAGQGIGRAHAIAFAEAGATVVVNDPAPAQDGERPADSVVATIEAAGAKAVANYDSVATREGADSIVWTALDKFGRVDILVNNAGILRDRSLLKMSDDQWDAVIAVHLKGTYLMTQAVARVLKRQGEGGRIINTTSVSGLVGNFGQANYGAAKMGIAGLTFVAAKEFERMGVTVNAIAPVALTQMTAALGRFGDVSEANMGPQFIAPAAIFLASELAADISGKILGVQGTRMFEYWVQLSDGVDLGGTTAWSPEQIKERWSDIVA